MNDPEKEVTMEVQLPAPTDNIDETFVTQNVDVPFYENFVCSLAFDETTKNVTPFPADKTYSL